MPTLDDRVLSLPPFSPVCTFCKHWKGAALYCDAFGDNPIPDEIWSGRNPHTKPFTGDNGLVFEKVDESDL